MSKIRKEKFESLLSHHGLAIGVVPEPQYQIYIYTMNSGLETQAFSAV